MIEPDLSVPGPDPAFGGLLVAADGCGNVEQTALFIGPDLDQDNQCVLRLRDDLLDPE
ncbi:MAG: hypothetical protein ACRDTS_13845 [Mycobacterium sp.]